MCLLSILTLANGQDDDITVIIMFFLEIEWVFDYNLLAYQQVGVRDVAQLGSALPWGGRGHGFKSHRSDQYQLNLPVSLSGFFIARVFA